MFWFFKKNNVELWNKYSLKSNNYLDVLLTIISIDKDVLWIHIYDNYNKEEIISHIPIFIKDFNRSNINFIWIEENLKDFSLSWYNTWKDNEWWVFNIKIEDLLDSFPINRLIFVREEDNNLRDYSIIKLKWTSVKAIFWEDGNNVILLFPLNKRVLFPKIGSPKWDLIINDFDFIELWNIKINDNIIKIWYYDYSIALGWKFDLEMFNFSYKWIWKDLYNILRIIKFIDYEILSFDNWNSVWFNDFAINFDETNNNYIFIWFDEDYIFSKENTELLLNKYIELLKVFIKDKNIIIK